MQSCLCQGVVGTRCQCIRVLPLNTARRIRSAADDEEGERIGWMTGKSERKHRRMRRCNYRKQHTRQQRTHPRGAKTSSTAMPVFFFFALQSCCWLACVNVLVVRSRSCNCTCCRFLVDVRDWSDTVGGRQRTGRVVTYRCLPGQGSRGWRTKDPFSEGRVLKRMWVVRGCRMCVGKQMLCERGPRGYVISHPRHLFLLIRYPIRSTRTAYTEDNSQPRTLLHQTKRVCIKGSSRSCHCSNKCIASIVHCGFGPEVADLTVVQTRVDSHHIMLFKQ
jgi:hypothetical protein